MSSFSNESILKLFFLIAPALYLVNTIVAASFALKYKEDSLYKKNTSIWLSYLILGASQGALQDASLIVKTLAWSATSFLVIESMSLFASDIFKIKNKIKSDTYLFLFGLISTCLLFNFIDNFFLAALPCVFFSAYPILRLFPLLRFIKSNNFSKNGYLVFSIAIAIHVVDYAYAASSPELIFPGYLLALMLATGTSCFTYAVLIERAIMEVEIKDLLYSTSRLAALGAMAAEIAHEIKNPLTVLSLNNYQLKQKLELDSLDKNYLQNKIEVCDRMTKRLISIMDTLKVSYQSGDQDDYKPVAIKDIFDETRILCEIRTSKFNINLTFDKSFSEYEIPCRSVQITQVLQNLIHNAVDVLETSKEKWIRVGSNLISDAHIEIFVSDSGPGVPVEIKHKIFDTLFTTKSNGKGTGLGLSIAKRFIEDHNGYLRLDSSSSHTKFIITLPIRKPSKALNNNADKKVS